MQRLDHFMADALGQYYGAGDPFGVTGDFITAPEISQLFGEIIGIWAVQKWMRMGSPATFNLIELGPGRGTLMADLLRGTAHIPEFHAAMHVHLVEMSESLKERQQETLSPCSVQWHNHLSAIPNDKPSIIIANEFFDALPVRQFKYKRGEWQEHYIAGVQTVWKDVENPPLKATLPPACEGDMYEFSQEQKDYAELIARYNGAALIIDYGYERSAYGDTLQALYKHQYCAITDHVGEADLTTHVDFECLATFFKHTSTKTQRQFLKENGIDIRYQQLNNPNLDGGYLRLIAPDQMGDLFKVLEINL